MASIVNLDDNLIAMVQNLHRACMDSIRVTGMQAESIEVWKRLLVNLFVPALKFVADGHGECGPQDAVADAMTQMLKLISRTAGGDRSCDSPRLSKCSQFCFQLIVANPVLMQRLYLCRSTQQLADALPADLKPDILWNVLLSLLDNLMTDEAREVTCRVKKAS
eukprot:757889-Hanusia_phi.AAC.2